MKIVLKKRPAARIAANSAPTLHSTRGVWEVDSTATNFGAQFVAAFGKTTSKIAGKKRMAKKKPSAKAIGKKA